jgi:hypothetical protein
MTPEQLATAAADLHDNLDYVAYNHTDAWVRQGAVEAQRALSDAAYGIASINPEDPFDYQWAVTKVEAFSALVAKGLDATDGRTYAMDRVDKTMQRWDALAQAMREALDLPRRVVFTIRLEVQVDAAGRSLATGVIDAQTELLESALAEEGIDATMGYTIA